MPGRNRRRAPREHPARRRAEASGERGFARAVVLALAPAVVAGCGDDYGDVPRYIPELPEPPPVAAAALTPLPAPFFVRATDVHGVVGTGVEFVLPVVEAEVRVPSPAGPAPAEPAIAIRSLRLIRPAVTFPVDTIVTGGLDFFEEVLEPRLRIERLVVEQGRAGTLAAPGQAPGRWLWRLRDVDLTARRIRLGGRAAGLAEGFEIVRAAAAGEIRSRPVALRGLAVHVERDAARFVAGASVRLSESRVSADFTAHRASDWVATIVADTFAFGDLAAIVPRLGAAAPGGGAGVVTLTGGAALKSIDVERLRAVSGQSVVEARGRVATGARGMRVEDALIEAMPARAVDVERIFGAAPPGGGRWTGWLAADGAFREGVRLRGDLAQRRETGDVSFFTIAGAVVLDPEAYLDIALRAAPFRAADTAFDAALRLIGPADSLAITGGTTIRGVDGLSAGIAALLLGRADAPRVLTGTATVAADPRTVRRLAGTRRAARADAMPGASAGASAGAKPGIPTDAVPGSGPGAQPGTRPAGPDARPPPPIVAEAEGRIVLAEDGALDVVVAVDSLPLNLVHAGPAVDSVRGVARGRVRLRGKLARPVIQGRLALENGGLFIEPLALSVDQIAGAARLVDGLLVVDTLGATAAGGGLEVSGAVRLFDGPRRFDLALRASDITVKDDAQGDVTLSADLALEGPFERPALTGRIHDLRGWVREDAFHADPALNLDDPPYAELARRVPWPEGSRLLARAKSARPPPIDARVVIAVDTTLIVIDEDSELYGAGEITVTTGPDDVEARGRIAIRGGYYAFFGNRFTVLGGTARFTGGVEPRVSLKAEHREDWGIGDGSVTTTIAPLRFPPLDFIAVGPAGRPNERLHRWSLLPESQTQLASQLIFGLEPQPVRGWRRNPVWRASNPEELTGERTEAQQATLLLSYAADEAYDYIPLNRGWLHVGTIQTGPYYPAPIVVGAMIGAGTAFSAFEIFVTQALDGDLVPGVRIRLDGHKPLGARVEAFSVPRFYPQAPAGTGRPGFFVRRKTGIGMFWNWEFGAGGRGISRRE